MITAVSKTEFRTSTAKVKKISLNVLENQEEIRTYFDTFNLSISINI